MNEGLTYKEILVFMDMLKKANYRQLQRMEKQVYLEMDARKINE